jgi:hypothetical protein
MKAVPTATTALAALAAILALSCSPSSPSYERVGKVKASYYGPWYRLDAAIVVPPGLTEAQLSKTVDKAVEEILAAFDADILLLRVFDSKDKVRDHGWSVAKAIHGPNGSLFGQPGDPFLTKLEMGPSRTTVLEQQEAEWERTAQKMGAAVDRGANPNAPDAPAATTEGDSLKRP